jgi:N-acetylneuraminate synthase
MSVYFIAEAGVNHNGSLEMAKRLVDVAAEAGADAVKFQLFSAAALASDKLERAEYQKRNDIADSDDGQLEMLKRLELSPSEFKEIAAYAQDRRIEFFASPFDSNSLSVLLNELGVDTIKVASGEITNLPLLLEIARSGKQIILSTGMSTVEEIRSALACIGFGLSNSKIDPSSNAFEEALHESQVTTLLKENVVLLHCVSDYPVPDNQINLRSIPFLSRLFGLRVGFSDHSLGIDLAPAAVALGASVIEKHITTDRSQAGPDHASSLEPVELETLIRQIRRVESALGTESKEVQECEKAHIQLARKHLIAAQNIEAGSVFSTENIVCIRSGEGESAANYWDVLGKVAPRNFSKGEPICLSR